MRRFLVLLVLFASDRSCRWRLLMTARSGASSPIRAAPWCRARSSSCARHPAHSSTIPTPMAPAHIDSTVSLPAPSSSKCRFRTSVVCAVRVFGSTKARRQIVNVTLSLSLSADVTVTGKRSFDIGELGDNENLVGVALSATQGVVSRETDRQPADHARRRSARNRARA